MYQLEQFMSELERQLMEIIDEVKGDSSNQAIAVAFSKTPIRKSASYKHTKKPSSTSKTRGIVNEGDRCPICSKGYVRKGPYGLYCSEYKNSGCKWRAKSRS